MTHRVYKNNTPRQYLFSVPKVMANPTTPPNTCCDGADQPRQAHKGSQSQNHNPDWFLTIFAEQHHPTLQLDGVPVTHNELHRSLTSAFNLTYAETVTRVSKRTKTTHIHSNARFELPGPCKTELKQWADNMLTHKNKFTANSIMSWNNVERWGAANDNHSTVFGVFSQSNDIQLVEAAMMNNQQRRNDNMKALFDGFEKEGQDPPLGHNAMWGSLNPTWDKDDVIHFLRHHAAYIHNTSMYVMRTYNHETRSFELDVYNKETAKNSLEKIVIEWEELNPKTNKLVRKKYTGVDYMSGGDILTYAGAIFDPASPHPIYGTVDVDYTDPAHRVFNLFRGFGYSFQPNFVYYGPTCPFVPCMAGRYAPIDTENVLAGYGVSIGHPADLFLRHGYEVLCAGDRECFDYLLKWISHIFQYPASKPGTAILVRSSQGAGKNTWFNILKPLISRKYFVDVTNKEHLSQKFNAHLTNKLFCLVDECVFGGAHEVNNIIKSLITQEDALMEKKFSDAIQTTSYQRFVFLSNESWPIKVEPSDRRFVCLEASPLRIAQTDYFDALIYYYQHKEVQEALYQFFLQVPDVPSSMPRPPSTLLHKELMEKSLPLELQFLRDIANQEAGTDAWGVNDNSWVTTEGMTEKMRQWADNNSLDGKRVGGIKKMGSVLGKILGEKARVANIKIDTSYNSGYRSWAYTMDYQKILAYKP